MGSAETTDINHTLQGILEDGVVECHEALALFRYVLDQVAVAHGNGKLHLALQPRSIHLVARGDDVVPEVRGYGKERSRSAKHYAAPEVDTHPDARCDVYALGAILYEMVLGEKATVLGGRIDRLRAARHDPVSLMQLAPQVPPHVLLACLRAMEHYPDARFTEAQEFGEALFGDYEPPALPARVLPALRDIARTARMGMVMVVGAAVVVLMTVAVIATYGVNRIEDARSLAELRSHAFANALSLAHAPVVDALVSAGAEPGPLREAQARFAGATDTAEVHAAGETLYRLIEQASTQVGQEDLLARREVDDRIRPLANSRQAYDRAVEDLHRVAASSPGSLAHWLSLVDAAGATGPPLSASTSRRGGG